MKTKATPAAIAIALLLAFAGAHAALAVPAQATATGTVTVTVRVNAKVECTVIDADHVGIRANEAWRLTADTGNGVKTITGDRTGNTPVTIELPAGTRMYFLTLDR